MTPAPTGSPGGKPSGLPFVLSATSRAIRWVHPTRKHRELADLAFLIRRPGVDRDEIRGYFTRFGVEAHLDDLES